MVLSGVRKENLKVKVEHKHEIIVYDIYILSNIILSSKNNPQTSTTCTYSK